MAWRRPVITDVTPPKPPPTAEKVAARHAETKKHWRKQRKRRAEEKPTRPEDVRLAHLRMAELQRLLRYRYGIILPDTAEARRDLEILVGYAILTGKKPQHQLEILAPWCDEVEADQMTAQRPVLHKADDLAQKLDLRYCDRQALAITTIGSVDVDQGERERLRLERRNAAKRRSRAAANRETRTMMTEPKPKDDLSRRQLAVLEKVDGAAIAAPELVEQVRRHKAFRGVAAASLRIVVHRTIDQLVAVGQLAVRNEKHPHGGKVRFVSRPQQ